MGANGRGLMLLLMAGVLIAPPVLASSWLMVADSGVLAPDRAGADRLLSRVATAPGIRVLTLRDADTGRLTFLATAADDAAGEAPLERLRQSLAEHVAGGELEVWQLEVDPQRSCQPTSSAFIAAPGFYRYALFAVTGDGKAVDRLLGRHAVLCRKHLRESGGAYGYQLLRGGGDGGAPEVIGLAAAASDRATLDRAMARVEQALGARGRTLMRRLEANWRPLSVIEGEWQRDLGVRALQADPPPGAPPPTRVAPLEPLPVTGQAQASPVAAVAAVDVTRAPPPTEVATVEPLPPIPPPAAADEATAADEAAPPSSGGAEQLAAAARHWARAWAEQRVEAYLDTYASTFVPPAGLSRAAWAAQRRQRLSAPSWIQVDIDGVVADLESPNRGWVEFVQRYRSDGYQDTVTKRLDLVREDGAWKIAGETVLDGD